MIPLGLLRAHGRWWEQTALIASLFALAGSHETLGVMSAIPYSDRRVSVYRLIQTVILGNPYSNEIHRLKFTGEIRRSGAVVPRLA